MRPGVAAAPRGDGLTRDDAARQLAMLTHELANLLEGAIRCAGLARGALAAGRAVEAAEKLATVAAALDHMAGAVRAVRPAPGPCPLWWVGAPGARRPESVEAARGSLAEAITRAVDVMRPIGSDCGISVESDLPAGFATLPGWGMYRVITDAVRNSLEAITGAGLRGGSVRIIGRIEARARPETALIDVIDDGPGPVRVPLGQESPYFHAGFTTKPGNSGLGLAAAREAVEAVGGTIALLQGGGGRHPRLGAVLRIRIPIPRAREKGAAA